MRKGSYYIGAAGILLLAGLAGSAEQLTHLLAPAIEPARQSQVQNGVLILKFMFFADAFLLFIYGVYLQRRPTTYQALPSMPLWTPTANPFGLRSDFSHYTQALFLLFSLALILRLITLNGDLWIDEVFTLVDFIRLPLGAIVTDFSSDNHHPFFSVLSHISVSLFGENAWSIRLPSLVFGLASIWVAMQLAKLLYGKRVAFYTGLLLTLSYHHIWFSQNARGYAILLFGTTLSTLLLLHALQSGRWRFWAAYAIVIAFSSWAHITAVFVSIAHAIVVLMLLLKSGRLKECAWMPLAGFIFAAWLTLHLYSLILPQMIDFFSQPGAGTGLVQTEWRSPLWLISEAFHRLGISVAFGWIGMGFVLSVAALYTYWFARQDWVILLIVILPGLILGSTMFMLGRNLWPRMFFNEIAFAMMLLVVATMATTELLRRKLIPGSSSWAADVPVVVLAAAMLTGLPDLYRFQKQDFTGARDFVLQNMAEDDRVVGIHMAGRMYALYYAEDWPEADSMEQLRRHESIHGQTWVLYTLSRHIKATKQELSHYLETRYEIVKVFPGTLGNGEIFVCRSKKTTE